MRHAPPPDTFREVEVEDGVTRSRAVGAEQIVGISR